MDYDKFRHNNYKQSTIKIATHYTTQLRSQSKILYGKLVITSWCRTRWHQRSMVYWEKMSAGGDHYGFIFFVNQHNPYPLSNILQSALQSYLYLHCCVLIFRWISSSRSYNDKFRHQTYWIGSASSALCKSQNPDVVFKKIFTTYKHRHLRSTWHYWRRYATALWNSAPTTEGMGSITDKKDLCGQSGFWTCGSLLVHFARRLLPRKESRSCAEENPFGSDCVFSSKYSNVSSHNGIAGGYDRKRNDERFEGQRKGFACGWMDNLATSADGQLLLAAHKIQGFIW